MHGRDTIVTIATVGLGERGQRGDLAGLLVPISSTAAWCSGPSRSSVSGSPHWLLNERSGLSTSQRVASTLAISSLVVVLPLLPVTATTGMVKRAR